MAVVIKESALRWFKSYSLDRNNFVHRNDESSSYDKVIHGVQHSTVLGLLLFTLYMLPSGNLLRHRFTFIYIFMAKQMTHNYTS